MEFPEKVALRCNVYDDNFEKNNSDSDKFLTEPRKIQFGNIETYVRELSIFDKKIYIPANFIAIESAEDEDCIRQYVYYESFSSSLLLDYVSDNRKFSIVFINLKPRVLDISLLDKRDQNINSNFYNNYVDDKFKYNSLVAGVCTSISISAMGKEINRCNMTYKYKPVYSDKISEEILFMDWQWYPERI